MKSALIIFPDEWLAYSPTMLNAFSILVGEGWHVTVFALDNSRYPDVQIDGVNIVYFTIPKLFLLRWEQLMIYQLLKFIRIFFAVISLRKNSYNLIIGVDAAGYSVAKLLFPSVCFLSLEIARNFFWKLACRLGIETLVIQSPERRHYLLGENSEVRTLYLQNAPIWDGVTAMSSRQGCKLIYFGNIMQSHGVEYCIELLRVLDDCYTLTIKGAVYDRYYRHLLTCYRDLIDEKRLIIDRSYLEQEKVVEYMRPFDIGFCLYSEKVICSNDYNYLSCPSGKLFNYFAAGLPVIGSKIIGLKPVEEFSCGILVGSQDTTTIKAALENIQSDYQSYVTNCFTAARHYDFSTAFRRILAVNDS